MPVTCSTCGETLSPGQFRCSNCLEAHPSRLVESIDRYYDASAVSNQGNDTYRTRETFREKVQVLLPRLERLAVGGVCENQSAVVGDGLDVWAMKHYLGAASAVEHWDNRPLLTSVIINEERGFPANGYFRLVERLHGLPDDITNWPASDKEDWWQEQLTALHDCWEE